MMKSYKRGFTLIELLVVIAIIGILAAIILASVSTARSKGDDAAIQGDLHDIQTQAELYASGNSNSYASMCSNTTIANALANVSADNGGTAAMCNVSGTSAYAIYAKLPAAIGTATEWCVDSTGNATTSTQAANTTATSCM